MSDGDPSEWASDGPAPRASTAGAPPVFEGHPLFPRADGSPEDKDIRFVTFLRRVDGAIKHCPEDIPKDEIQDWGQVTDWWGGGEYQAIAKTAQHVVIRHYPSKSEWVCLDGPPLPLVKRGPRPAAAAARASEAAAPQASALPAGMAEVLGVLTKIVDRLDRQPTAPQGGGSDVMIAMINGQASRDAATAQANATRDAATAQANATVAVAEAKARAEAQVAMAKATTENNQFLLGVLTKGGDGSGSLASALAMLKPYLKPEGAPVQDPLAVLERFKDLGILGAPAAASIASEIKPIAETFGAVWTQQIAAEGKAKVAEAEVRKEEIKAGRGQEGPPRREREREPPPLLYVPGIGMVHVVAADTVPRAPAPAAPVVQAPPAALAPVAVVQAPAPSAPAPSVPVPAPVASAAPPAPHPTEPPVVAAPPAPVEPATPPAPARLRLVPPPADPPVPDPLLEEVPAEVRSVIQQAVADVTLEDKAQIAGALGRLKQVPVAARIPVIQRFFPTLDEGEAKQWAEMVDNLPMLAIYDLVERIQPVELQRIKHLNGSGG